MSTQSKGRFGPNDLNKWFAMIHRPDIVGELAEIYGNGESGRLYIPAKDPRNAHVKPLDVQEVGPAEIERRLIVHMHVAVSGDGGDWFSKAEINDVLASLVHARLQELTQGGRYAGGIAHLIADCGLEEIRRHNELPEAHTERPSVFCPFCACSAMLVEGLATCPRCTARIQVCPGDDAVAVASR